MPNLDCSKILKSRELKTTQGRIAVLETFLSENKALSHTDLEQKLSDTTIDRVTIYRILECFVENDILHKVSSEQAIQLFALNQHHQMHEKKTLNHQHAHFICDNCDRVECVDLPTDENHERLYEQIGYVVSSIDITIHGFCKNCITHN